MARPRAFPGGLGPHAIGKDAARRPLAACRAALIATLLPDPGSAEKRKELLKDLALPAKIKILPHVFRQSNPAVVGVEVLAGRIIPKTKLVNRSNEKVGEIMQIQDAGETLAQALLGQQIAVSIKGPIVGRQINVDDELFVDMSENQAIELQRAEIKELLTGSDFVALNDLIEIKRKYSGQKFWGVP